MIPMDTETKAIWVENYSAMDTMSLLVMRVELEKFPEDAEHVEIVSGILNERREQLKKKPISEAQP